jgi:LPS O-antigen subunit length determinant protein (WzzB/FepE family)
MNNEIKEIDLLKVVAYIFHHKLVIIVSLILSLCLGLIYINTLVRERVLYLNLDTLKYNELYEYSLVNFLATKINTLNEDIIDEEPLLNNFLILNTETFGFFAQTIFNDRLVKNNIIKSHNFINILLEQDIQLDNFVSNFVLLDPILDKASVDLSGRKLTPYYQLKLKTSLDVDEQDYKNLFSYVLNNLEILVKEEINDMYQKKINMIEIKNRFELDYLTNKKQNLIDDYIINRKSRLLYLEQNLSIARAIEQNPQGINRSSLINDTNININTPLPYYFFGSAAIKQEILEVKKSMSVTDPNVAIDGILDVENAIRKINQNKYAEKINIAIDNSPLGENNTFKLFSYNVNDLEYKDQGLSNHLIIFFFGLVGVFIGFLLIFIFHMRKKIDNIS